MEQRRLEPGRLLNAKGHLAQAGYATSLVKDYVRRDIRAGKLRIKEWDYYLITNGVYAVALTLADNAYMGLAGASVLRFDQPQDRTASVTRPLTLGSVGMTATSAAGEELFNWGRVRGRFVTLGKDRHLRLHMENFDGNQPFDAHFILTDPPQDTMVIATPFADKPKAFYYNQKIIGMTAQGEATVGGETISFSPKDSLALLDWGRGVWVYESTWYWSAASGYIDGKKFGFNLGYGFGDTSAATENMLFYDGKAHKLEHVSFGIPTAEDGGDDFLKPWHFTSSDDRFDAVFTPVLDRHGATSIGPLLSDPHQVFGHFDGRAVLDDGTVIPLTHFFGFAEKVHKKW
ncbi:MAG: DUF2804 domain-containing protein [Eubacteriales bacterium]|nr:DUF2804 domain-containing protein [Eubacteriales bacterium]